MERRVKMKGITYQFKLQEKSNKSVHGKLTLWNLQQDKLDLHYCGFGVSVSRQNICFYHHMIL